MHFFKFNVHGQERIIAVASNAPTVARSMAIQHARDTEGWFGMEPIDQLQVDDDLPREQMMSRVKEWDEMGAIAPPGNRTAGSSGVATLADFFV